MHYVELWKEALMRPKETFATEVKNASLMDGIKQVAILSAVAGLVWGLGLSLANLWFVGVPGSNFLAGLGLGAIIAAPILFVIMGVVLGLVVNAVAYGISSALGGKGTFEQQFYLNATWGPALALVQMVLNVLPVVGWIILWLANLYALYLLWLMFQSVHGFDATKSAAVIVALLVVWVVLSVLLGGLLGLGGLGAPVSFGH